MDATARYYFIINPISGNGKGKKLIPLIEEYFHQKGLDFTIQVTTEAGEARKLAAAAIQKKIEVIVAVGGDGTVNEVAGQVAGSESTLGVIPIGSGNGLAREVNIPLDIRSALRNLVHGQIQKIDTGTCNGHFFACTAGIGFDAQMAHSFLHLKNRGLVGYVKTFLKDFFNYQSTNYHLQYNHQKLDAQAFLITIANSKQWGNEFYISPLSKTNDGIFEVCILRKFPLVIFPILLFRILNKTIHKSKYVTILHASHLTISNTHDSFFHTDGEVFKAENNFQILLNPLNLSIITRS